MHFQFYNASQSYKGRRVVTGAAQPVCCTELRPKRRETETRSLERSERWHGLQETACNELLVSPPVCWHPNPRYLRMWPCSEIGSLTDVIKFRWGPTGLRRAINQCDWGKFGQRQTQKMPGDCGGRDYSYAAANPGLSGASRSWKRKKREILPRRQAESTVLPTPWFQTSSLQPWGTNFCYLTTPSWWYSVTTALGNRKAF